MGTVTLLETARRRRVVSRYCTACRTLWALTAIRRGGGAMIVLCRHCGHSPVQIPLTRRDDGVSRSPTPRG